MPLSRADVRKHLSDLGYYDVSDDLLDVFVKDLNEYVESSDISRCSSSQSINTTGLRDVTNTSTRKRITRHRNGDVSVRETPSFNNSAADISHQQGASFDISDSVSTISLSTVDEDKPFPRRVWDENERLPSCIIPRPVTVHKTDPLKKYKKYENTWAQHNVPGEKRHTALRSAIRRQMMECDLAPFVAPQRPVTVNRYEVPTSKKREKLRWAVRNEMMG